MKDPQHQSGQSPQHPFPWQLAAVAAVACAGLTVGAYAVGVRPILAQRQHESAQREALQDKRATASDLSGKATDLERELTAAKEVLARTPVRLQPATLVNERLVALARLATECGLALDEVRPGNPTDATHYQTVPIRIVGSGSYPSCATFLRNLRKTFGDMGIRTFNAANVGAVSATPSANFQAELVWFTELPRK
jgi:Tfp pilus assembly protein PilO